MVALSRFGGWRGLAPNPLARFEAQGVVCNGEVYVFGGFDTTRAQVTGRCDVYDPATNRWARLPDQPERFTHAATITDGGTVWFFGGFVGDDPGQPTSHVWKFNVVTQRWSRGISLPAARAAGGAALVGRDVHFFGGIGGGNLLKGRDESDHWSLNIDRGVSWRRLSSMPNARNHLGATTLGGLIYAIGGQHGHDEANGNQNTVNVFNPATNKWSTVQSLPIGRGHIQSATFAFNGRVVVVGGAWNGGQSLSDVTAYTPGRGWLRIATLPASRKAAVAVPLGNSIFVTTGEQSLSRPLSSTYDLSFG